MNESLEANIYQLIQINRQLSKNLHNLHLQYQASHKRYELIGGIGVFFVIASVFTVAFLGFIGGI